MLMQTENIEDIKNICADFFDDYDIADFKIENDEVIFNIKRKSRPRQNMREVLNGFLKAILKPNAGSPI